MKMYNGLLYRRLVRIIAFTLFAAVFASGIGGASSAYVASGIDESPDKLYADCGGRPLIVSNKGFFRQSAENTLKAVRDAGSYGADIARVDVKRTSDGRYVLFADDDLTRMTGGKVTSRVADMTLSQLESVTLLSGSGGYGAKETGYTIPALEDALSDESVDCMLMLSGAWQYRNELYELIKDRYLEKTILLFEGVGAGEASQWLAGCEKPVNVCLYHKGNVIFGARSCVRKACGGGINSVWLASRVPYSVSFSAAVTSLAEGRARLMIDLTDPETSGRLRADSETWWDEAVRRNFGMIVTDDVPGMRRYLQGCLDARNDLVTAYDVCVTGYELPAIKADSFAPYKKAYNEAKNTAEALLADGAAARSELQNASAALYKAVSDIAVNYESLKDGTAGVTVTPGRIAASVIAVAAVAGLEVFMYKKKAKKRKEEA